MTAGGATIEQVLDAPLTRAGRRLSRRQSAARIVQSWWPAVFGFVVFFGGWEIAVRVTNTPRFILPPPSFVATRFWVELPGLLSELTYTLTEASIGLLIGGAIGVVGAVVMIQSRLLERSLFPIAVLIKLVPFVALAPLVFIQLSMNAACICATTGPSTR